MIVCRGGCGFCSSAIIAYTVLGFYLGFFLVPCCKLVKTTVASLTMFVVNLLLGVCCIRCRLG